MKIQTVTYFRTTLVDRPPTVTTYTFWEPEGVISALPLLSVVEVATVVLFMSNTIMSVFACALVTKMVPSLV